MSKFTNENLVQNQQESDLIIRAQAGDLDALADLYNLHAPNTSAFLRRLVGPDEAEDITSIVFERMLTKIGNFTDTGMGLAPWLHRIAHNEAIRYLSSAPRRRNVWDNGAPDADGNVNAAEARMENALPAVNDVADDVVATLTDVALTKRIDSGLTLEQSKVIKLIHLQGYSYEEAAEHLGLSLVGTKAIAHRGIKAIKNLGIISVE